VVFVTTIESADDIGAATYGGVAMEVYGPVLKATGETSGVHIFILGTGIPSGAQTVSVVNTGSTSRAGVAISVTASADTLFDFDEELQSDSLDDPTGSINLESIGVPAFVLIGFVSGVGAVGNIGPLTDWTARNESDLGVQCSGVYTYDIIDAISVTYGYTSSAADDVNLQALAVRERPTRRVKPISLNQAVSRASLH
jgi:hypothetical protein